MSAMFTAVCPASGPVQRLASKYLLSEQMSKPILIPRIGHSQKLGRLKTSTLTVHSVTLGDVTVVHNDLNGGSGGECVFSEDRPTGDYQATGDLLHVNSSLQVPRGGEIRV